MSKDISEIRYFNFPICFLKDIFSNKMIVLNNIFDYSIYTHTFKLKNGSPTDKIKASYKYFGVSGSFQNTLKNGKLLFDSIPTKSPKTNITVDLYFDYYQNEKDEFQIAVFCGLCAIRSILLYKQYCKVTNNFMLVRMAGLSTVKEINNLPEPLKKHARTPNAINYYLRKIKIELVSHWKLKIYAKYTRGFYVSFDTELTELALKAVKKTQKYIEKNYSNEQIEARKAAYKKLYETPTTAPTTAPTTDVPTVPKELDKIISYLKEAKDGCFLFEGIFRNEQNEQIKQAKIQQFIEAVKNINDYKLLPGFCLTISTDCKSLTKQTKTQPEPETEPETEINF